MEKQIAIRPQDVVVLLKIISLEKSGKTWMKKDLAESLKSHFQSIDQILIKC